VEAWDVSSYSSASVNHGIVRSSCHLPNMDWASRSLSLFCGGVSGADGVGATRSGEEQLFGHWCMERSRSHARGSS